MKEMLDEQIKKVSLPSDMLKSISAKVNGLKKEILASIKKNKVRAEIFIGGSFAKNTMIRKAKQDIDIFIRFDRKYKEEEIARLLGRIAPKNALKLHGSRDYYVLKEDALEFEIIPTVAVNEPSEARNVTDLSYFHVKYVAGKISKNKKLADEIKLAKSFVHASGCYGAESYINGFSGYAVELLVLYYKGFVNFIKSVVKTNSKEKLVIDPEKFYKKDEVFREMNEAKLASPIIFIDPTFKERNALAALSTSCFKKFKEYCSRFLKNPRLDFFEPKDIEADFSRKNKDLIEIKLATEKQAGDIAGTKLKKFAGFFIKELGRYFDVRAWEFVYDESENFGKILISAKEKKEIVFSGPPIAMKEPLSRFKKEHKNIKIVKGQAFAYEKSISFDEFLNKLLNEKSKVIEEMDVSKIEKS